MTQQTQGTDIVQLGLLALAFIVLVPILMMVVAVPILGMHGATGVWGGHMWGDGSYAAPVWSIVVPLLWLGVLLAVGYVIYRWATNRHPGAGDPAIDELRLAYARGDLTEEEFEQRRSNLRPEE